MVLFSDSVVAGAVSGGVTRLLIQPLDVLKVRFQLQLEAIGKVQYYFPVSQEWVTPHFSDPPVKYF